MYPAAPMWDSEDGPLASRLIRPPGHIQCQVICPRIHMAPQSPPPSVPLHLHLPLSYLTCPQEPGASLTARWTPCLYIDPLLVPLLPTPASEVDHDVSLSIMDTGKPQWGHTTPDLEGTSKGIIHCLRVQIRRVANDPGGGRNARECVCVCKVYIYNCVCVSVHKYVQGCMHMHRRATVCIICEGAWVYACIWVGMPVQIYVSAY